MARDKKLPEGWISTYRGTVFPWHCDHIGHMNVMWFVGKFDEATWHLFSSLGLTPSYFREKHRGMAGLEQRISYQRELRAGDIVAVRSAVLEMGEKVMRYVHEMVNEETGERSAVTLLTAVHMDTRIRKSCSIPNSILRTGREKIIPFDPEAFGFRGMR